MKEVNLLRWLMFAGISILVSGCAATVPLMPDKLDAEAERFMPRTGKANIYVVREDVFTGSAVMFQVLLNGRIQGGIAPGTYLLFEVPHGSHAVAVITQESADSEKIEASDGKNYFVEIKPTWGTMSARASIERIGEDRGRQLVIDGKRAELLITE